MRRDFYRFAISVVLVWLAQADLSLGQGPGPSRATFKAGDANLFPQELPRDTELTLEHNPQVPKSQIVRHKQVANFLNNTHIGVPDDRLLFFSAMISPDSPPVTGWDGIVESVTSTRTGTIVSLRVHARQERTIDPVSLIERYVIENGQVSYIGAFEPRLRTRIISGF